MTTARGPAAGTTAEATPAARWRAVRRLLAIRLDGLGDVLMATPALRALRHALPEAHIALLGSSAAEALHGHLPDVDAILAAGVSWMPAGRLPSDERALVRRLADGNYDAAVVFTTCTQSALPAALVCTMAGIPLRLAHSRENAYGLLTDRVPETDAIADGMRHEVLRQLALVAHVGVATDGDRRLRFHVRDLDRAAARRHLAQHVGGGTYAVVHPGASAPSRRYAIEKLARAIGQAAGRHPVHWILAGHGDDVPLVRALDAALPAGVRRSVRLGAPLGELAALLEGASLFVGNNSGPMHLAAAMGTPSAVAYALTNPQHTPWGVPARVLSHPVGCRHCLKSTCPERHHLCLEGVPPDALADAALALLALGREPHARTNAATGTSVADTGPLLRSVPSR